MKQTLLNKIKNKTLTCGVIGLGYVGLPLAVEKAKAGFKTLGFDVQKEKVDMVNKGDNYIGDVVDSDLKILVEKNMLKATTNFIEINELDFIAICVPTPLDAYQQPDVSYIKSSAEKIGENLKKGTIIVLESTTYPGTTRELLKPILEVTSGLVCGRDFYLGFSPERVDPNNKIYNTKNTPKVVGAIGDDALEVISALYNEVLDAEVHQVSSPDVAEMEKILENTYRNVNIGLVNELAILCNKMGINFWEVIDAAKSKPYGFQAFYPGPGLGGHCIPLDPYYLSWKAREYGFHTSMIESSMMINDKMPEYCVERVFKILNRFKKSVSSSNILILGVSYKQDIDDCRESPALNVIKILLENDANVTYYDPHVKSINVENINMVSEIKLTKDILEKADLVMITTNHTAVDYNLVQKYSKVIFDTKNAMKDVTIRDNIELL